jgi:hypothetical protein
VRFKGNYMPGDPGPERNIPFGIRKGRWEDHDGLKIIASRRVKYGARRGRNLRATTLLASAAAAVVLVGMILGKLGSGGNQSGPQHPTSQAYAPTVKVFRIIIASTIFAQPSSQVPVQARIDPVDEIPGGGFLLFRGLISGISLSEGNAVAVDAWSVPLARLSNLKVFVAPDVSGRCEINISLVGLDETILTEARTTLIIGPDRWRAVEAPSPSSIAKPVSNPTEAEQLVRGSVEQPRPVLVETKSPPPQFPVVTAARHIHPNKASTEELLVQVAQRIETGDVTAARELLVGADDGEQGAILFALAETYDPNMLAAWGTRGMAADAVKARELYRKAFGLGVARAQNRLDALN